MFFDPREAGMKPEPFKHSVYSALVVPRPIGWISPTASSIWRRSAFSTRLAVIHPA